MPYENDRFPPLPQRWPGSVVGKQVVEEPVASFLTRYPRVAASATVTVTGTVTTGNVLDLTVTLPALPGGAITLAVTAGGGDTTTSLAQKLSAAVCNNSVFKSYGVYATSLGNVISIYWPGPLGNFASVVFNGGGVPIVTLTGTLTTGDYVNVLVTNAALPGGKHNVQYHVVSGDTTLTLLATHIKNALNADATLLAAGIGATSSGGVVTITYPVTIGNVTVACNTNGVETATLSGTIAAGDILTVVVHDAALGGGATTINYTAVSGDSTLTLLATHLAAAINAGTGITAAGIVATPSGAVVSLASTSVNATTYTESVNTTPGGGSEVITLAAGPSETATASGNTTEAATVVEFSGGSGPVIPFNTFRFSYNKQMFEFQAHRPMNLPGNVVAALAQAGSAIS